MGAKVDHATETLKVVVKDDDFLEPSDAVLTADQYVRASYETGLWTYTDCERENYDRVAVYYER
jgi:hypothetical protein